MGVCVSEYAFVDERCPQGDCLVAVDLEHTDHRAPYGGLADEERPFVTEMVTPFVTTGIEEAGELAC